SQELPAVNRIFRPPLAIGASIACAAASLVWLAPGAQAIPEAGASSALRFPPPEGRGAPAAPGRPPPAAPTAIPDLARPARGGGRQRHCRPGRARLGGGQQRDGHPVGSADLRAVVRRQFLAAGAQR